jgi:hypothetical protein
MDDPSTEGAIAQPLAANSNLPPQAELHFDVQGSLWDRSFTIQ